jgi:hypothetical protein
MQIEILALRHQLAVLQRRKTRVRLKAADRLLWVIISRFWKQWRSALVIVKPETVIAWHRKDFVCIGAGRVEQGSVVDRVLVLKRESLSGR